MNYKNIATTTAKTACLTVMVLGVSTYYLGKKIVTETKEGVVFAKDVYNQCKTVINKEGA